MHARPVAAPPSLCRRSSHIRTGGSEVDNLASFLQVSDLKAALRKHNQPFSSRAAKSELVETLIRLVTESTGGVSRDGGDAQAAADETLAAGENQKECFSMEASEAEAETAVVPGTQRLQAVATAAEAANEKARAGENRAVEHVALGDNDVAGNLL
jgi:hypothetical protein